MVERGVKEVREVDRKDNFILEFHSESVSESESELSDDLIISSIVINSVLSVSLTTVPWLLKGYMHCMK